MQEPIKCPHGGEVYALSDGSEYWSVPCPTRACETETVAVPAQVKATNRALLSA